MLDSLGVYTASSEWNTVRPYQAVQETCTQLPAGTKQTKCVQSSESRNPVSDHHENLPETSTRTRISTGNPFEIEVGYSRAIRYQDRVFVAGTTAITRDGDIIGEGDVYLQTRQTLETIRWALEQAGATLDDIVRYRIYLTSRDDIPAASKALSETFQAIRPANTLVVVAALADERMLVEIDADAIVGSGSPLLE